MSKANIIKEVLYMSKAIEQGIMEVMSVLEGTNLKETVYDGQGHVIEVNGKKVAKGYKKNGKRIKDTKQLQRESLLSEAQVVLNRSVAFEGKVHMSETEGIIVRMRDADYSVKCTMHSVGAFTGREEGFVATKNYMTRGKTENHSPAIIKILVAEIENQNSVFKIKNENSVSLLEAKSNAVRFDVQGVEYSFKVTRKRARVSV